jgi:hypothetical protein
VIVTCPECEFNNELQQPHPYHAGFGDTIFLYNEAGNCTLTWGTYDPRYERLIGQSDPWRPSEQVQAQVEAGLVPSPKGDRWGFANPARCGSCGSAIRQPMISGEIYYLEYPDSVVLGRAGLPSMLATVLTLRPST